MKQLKIALALSSTNKALVEQIQTWDGVEITKEVPYFNRSVLHSLLAQAKLPEVVIVGEDLPGDGDVSLTDFIYELRKHNIRIVFLADTASPGDVLLHDLVKMGVTDIILGGTLHVWDLKAKVQQPTPWAAVAYLLNTNVSPVRGTTEGPTLATAVKEVVREVIVERVVQGAAQPTRGVVTVVGLGVPGIGVTTIATSLAAALVGTGAKVALVDADPRDSAVKDHLNLSPEHDALASVLQGVPANRAGEHAAGVQVFAPRPFPAVPTAATMKPTDMMALVDRIRATADRIIIDAGHQVDEPITQIALQLATDVLVVCDLDVHHANVGIHTWPKLNRITEVAKVKLVVNRVGGKLAKPEDIVNALQGPGLAAAVPLVEDYADALVEGKSLFQHVPAGSPFWKAIRAVAGLPEEQPARKGWFRK